MDAIFYCWSTQVHSAREKGRGGPAELDVWRRHDDSHKGGRWGEDHEISIRWRPWATVRGPRQATAHGLSHAAVLSVRRVLAVLLLHFLDVLLLFFFSFLGAIISYIITCCYRGVYIYYCERQLDLIIEAWSLLFGGRDRYAPSVLHGCMLLFMLALDAGAGSIIAKLKPALSASL